MCVAIPYKIIEVMENGRAQIDVSGARQEISIQMVPEAKAGDYVIVYLGSAISKVDEEEAAEVLRLYQEMAELEILQDIAPARETTV